MARKIHLRVNKLTGSNQPMANCASRGTGNGKLTNNNRATYRFMTSEVVGINDFINVPSADRCAHCVAELPYLNARRARLGLPEWAIN